MRNDNLKRTGDPQINNPALEVAHDEIKLSGEIHSEEKPELAPQKKTPSPRRCSRNRSGPEIPKGVLGFL